MANEREHLASDLGDFENRDSSETLDGPPGDDPLDRGLATPERWSAAMRLANAGEPEERETMDELLSEEEPDVTDDQEDELPEDVIWDDSASREDIGRRLAGEDLEPRAGRLIGQVEGDAFGTDDDLVASDAGIDGGGASAEEAAVHVKSDEDEAGSRG